MKYLSDDGNSAQECIFPSSVCVCVCVSDIPLTGCEVTK